MVSEIERAEAKSRARAWVMGLLALVVAVNSTFGLDNPANDAASFRGGMWLLTVALALAVLASGGGLMLNRRLRALMNDERSQANRSRAFVTAFFAAILVAAGLYVVTWSTPIDVRAALRLVTGFGLAAGLARYALLEAF